MEILRTLQSFCEERVRKQKKSILLLGPRQTGKSSLLKKIKPDLVINLARESEFRAHLQDPDLLEKQIKPLIKKQSIIFVDEIQRIPELINTIQAIIDDYKNVHFLLSGSSARKLKKNKVNLLPGRIFSFEMYSLSYWELEDQFDLKKILSIGSLPEIYLESYGPDLLEEYIDTYLREEVIAEALVRNIANFSHFLNLAASISWQELNYSQLASDSEIPKETLRRYLDILSETMIIKKIPGYTQVKFSRKAVQKEKIIFFDIGVRNGILGIHKNKMTEDQLGPLFEQWIVLQIIIFNSYYKKKWKFFYYRDDRKTEVDLILETDYAIYAIEMKWSEKYRTQWLKPLKIFQSLHKKKVLPIIVYRGSRRLEEDGVSIFPFKEFLEGLKDFT